MNVTVEYQHQDNDLLVYSEDVEKFFKTREFFISTYPVECSDATEIDFPNFKITSAKQYCEYLDREIRFWSDNDPKSVLTQFSKIGNLKNAKQKFDIAITLQNTNPTNIVNLLNQSIGFLDTGSLYSETKLAGNLLELREKSVNFLNGFKFGFLNQKSGNVQNNGEWHEGFYCALAMLDTMNKFRSLSVECISNFEKSIAIANNNYAQLNDNYTQSFFEEKKRLDSIVTQTNLHFDDFNQKKDTYFTDAAKKLTVLENQYKEKLKLSAPIVYWDKMEKEYAQKGKFWIRISCCLATGIIVLLISLLLFAPDVFSKESHWLENFKNSALITVITSIAVYILRLTVKMAMSSYHLSRDAKERSNLTYVYLALIEGGAVTDKERALVLNALFSRTDTGLLKGDSSPSMPSNISDLIDIVNKSSN